jgi:hypothetical protein
MEIISVAFEAPREGDFWKVESTHGLLPECLHFFGSGLMGGNL